MTSHAPLVFAVVVVGAALVGITLAGPLNPPAGPVAPTSPSLSDVLTAVQNSSAPVSGCSGAAALPGVPTTGSIEFGAAHTSDLLEFSLGGFRAVDSSGRPTGGARAFEITATRIADVYSPMLLRDSHLGIVYPIIRINQGNPGMRFRLINATVYEIRNEMVTTCDGPVSAERIKIATEELEYEIDGVSFGWNYTSNQPN